MASIAKLSVQMAWEGSEVTKGAADAAAKLNQVGNSAEASGKSAKQFGSDMSDAAKKTMEAARDNDRFIKSLEKMNALEQENAKIRRETQQRRMGMTKDQIIQDIDKESNKRKMEGMNALEKRDFLAAEATKQRRMKMTASQIEADIAAEKKASEKKAANEEWAKKGMFEKIATMAKGAQDVMAAGSMISMAASNVLAFARMGAALETMTIRAEYMTGSVKEGNKAIKELRDLSVESGVPLSDLAKAFQQFTAAGISTAGAATILAQTGNAVELLGGGAAGANAVAGAITEMRLTATATEGPLRNLQRSGLKVFEALAQELSNVTGKAHTVEDALAAVRDKAVSNATAIRAIFVASNTKEAVDAAKKMGDSFEGQLQRLSTGFTDLLTEISKQLISMLKPEQAFAALKGAFQGVKEVVQEIAEAFMPVIDPGAKGEGLKSIFESSRQIAKDVANKLIEGVTQLKTMFDEVVAGIRQLMEDYKGLPTPKNISDAVKFEFTSALPGEDPNSEAAKKRHDARLREEKAIDDDFLNMLTFGLTGPGVHAKSELVSPALKPNELMPVVEAKAKADKLMAEMAANAEKTARIAADNLAAQGKMLEAQAAADEAQAAKNLAEELKACTAAMNEQSLASLDLENATKDNEKLTAEILKNNMSITEKFAETIGNIESMMAQAAKGSKESADKLRAAQTRVVGKQLQDMVKQFATPQAGTAQAFVAGSAGAAEAQIRARVESINANVDPQKQLVAAAAEAARQDAIQAVQMARLVKAAENANIIKPGTLVIPK
jgi:hypothetical protein